ncbi:MAG: hypothetical protein PHV54_01605 [Tolumonas sp.]|nr:hypothetical protein [Tolumonas sp.]
MEYLEDESVNKSKFFYTKLLNGDYGLAKSFWLFAFLSNLIMLAILAIAKDFTVATGNVFPLLITAIFVLWWRYITFVGTWRSCISYNGHKIFKVTAKALLVFGLMHLIFQALSLKALFSYI